MLQTKCILCNMKIKYKTCIPKYCMECKKDKKNNWRKKRYNENKTYRKKVLLQNEEYRIKHKKQLAKYIKLWRKTKSGINSYVKYKTTQSYKNKILKRRLHRREVLKNIIHNFTLKDWNYMLKKTKGICPGCNKNVGMDKLTLDHIYPVSVAYKDFLKTGIQRIYTTNDIQPLCSLCNGTKNAKIEEK